jgi:cell division protein ZapA
MGGVVTVEIAGQQYPIRSGLDAAYVAELAAYVDQKMRAASDAAPATDRLGLAVLVALNLADECFRARQQDPWANGQISERAQRLERLVDEALGIPDAPLLSELSA